MENEMIYGIVYEMYCTKTDRYYIGGTTKDLKERRYNHKYESKQEHDGNEFYNDMKEYGIEAFTMKPIKTASTPKQLTYLEDYYILEYQLEGKDVYNNNKGGGGYSIERRKRAFSHSDAECIIVILTIGTRKEIGAIFNMNIDQVSRLKNGIRRKYLLDIVETYFNGVRLTLEQAERLKHIKDLNELKNEIHALR